MIIQLDNKTPSVSEQIYAMFQASYPIEAAFIGTKTFPPLERSSDSIALCENLFFGFYCQDELAGVMELVNENNHLHIQSLTVHPSFFRKGIGHKMVEYALSQFSYLSATVETAAVNAPAIALYEKNGFMIDKTWTPSHGIEKVAMSLKTDF